MPRVATSRMIGVGHSVGVIVEVSMPKDPPMAELVERVYCRSGLWFVCVVTSLVDHEWSLTSAVWITQIGAYFQSVFVL